MKELPKAYIKVFSYTDIEELIDYFELDFKRETINLKDAKYPLLFRVGPAYGLSDKWGFTQAISAYPALSLEGVVRKDSIQYQKLLMRREYAKV